MKLSHLTLVRQQLSETASKYIRRFRDTRNRCYSLTISDRDLADLAYSGLLDYHKEKLDGQEFLDVSQVLQKAMANENRLKESRNPQKSNEKTNRLVYAFDCESNSSDDESKEVLVAEFVWPSKAKSYSCSSLKPVHKNRQEEMKFTFDTSKCDRIFYELHKNNYIKLTYTLSSNDGLKRRAYCKWHNSFSHATNDCNVFR